MEKHNFQWKSIGHLFEDAAKKSGDKPFLIFENDTLSYTEVKDTVNRFCNSLEQLGVKKGDRISVMLGNGFEFPITWLAIAKLGAIIVPTNPNYQSHDLDYILEDSGATFMVIYEDFLPKMELIKGKSCLLKEIVVVGKTPPGYHSYREMILSGASQMVEKDIRDADLMNIQYTSGTTGFPKGCMLTHRFWLLTGNTVRNYVKMRSDDINFTAQPFYYADPQWNVVLCMMGGIPLVIMPKFSVSNFWPTVAKNKVTMFYVVGVMPNFLLSRKPDDIERNHCVRIVICSGIVPQLHETIEKRFKCPWREAYGLTEAGMDFYVPIDDIESVGSGAVGVSHTPSKEAMIVDAEGIEVPDGRTGELILRGEPMMVGYWRKPEATKEIFRGGWCHTGDLAYRDQKGYLHLVGRIKDMVRRGGENISSVEVETVLAQHEKIRMSAVISVPDISRGEEVKAYIVLIEGETSDSVPPEDIIGFARTKMASFKVPRYIEYVDDLPRTPSERVEKHKLIQAKNDLRLNSYDAETKIWITGKVLEKLKSKA